MTAPAAPPQLMLPGQAAAPDGPCDLNPMYVIHHALRRDLRRFAEAVCEPDRVAIPDVRAALLERWDRFASLLHDHHSKEDVVLWPLLHERATAAGDDGGLRVLADMEAEHARIDPLLERTHALFTSLATSSEADRAATRRRLAEALDAVSNVLDQHLAHEEREAVPLMQHYITSLEWARLANKDLRGKPSLSEILYFMPWAAMGLDQATMSQLLAEGGVPVRLLLRLGRPRFERLERRAFSVDR